MKTPILLFAFAFVAAGCGGSSSNGADPEPEPGSKKTPLACTQITADADVCALDLDPRSVRALERVTAFAKTAFALRSAVDDACRTALVDLGRTPSSTGKSCDELVRVIEASTARLRTTVEDATCTAVPAPPCAGADAPPRKICAGGHVDAAPPDDATDVERLVASVVTRRYDAIVRTRRELESISELAGGVSREVQNLGDLPNDCVPAVTDLAARASTSVNEAIAQSSVALAALTDRP